MKEYMRWEEKVHVNAFVFSRKCLHSAEKLWSSLRTDEANDVSWVTQKF